MLVPLSIALAGLVTTKRVSYRGASYGATVVPATTPGRPALVLLPPIGVGIDRTFCGRLVDAWAEAAPGPALHAIDVLGVGDSEPKPRMRRPFGGWDQVRVMVRVRVGDALAAHHAAHLAAGDMGEIWGRCGGRYRGDGGGASRSPPPACGTT